MFADVALMKCVDRQSTVDKLIKKTNLALVIGTHTWREQFVEAVTVSAGEMFARHQAAPEGNDGPVLNRRPACNVRAPSSGSSTLRQAVVKLNVMAS